MGKFFETIPEKTIQWCLQQKMFWVASAPLSGNGHVNISPKGGDEVFGIPNDTTFWYLDLSGSGNETIAHMYEPGNGRVTIMFNAFDGPPEIVRFWGHGRVLEFGTHEFDDWVERYNVNVIPGTRSIIIVDIHQVGSSCGYSVPLYDFREHRQVLNDLWKKRERDAQRGKSDHSMPKYWAYKSAWSIDGLPGMKLGLATGKAENIEPMEKMTGIYANKGGSHYYAVHTQKQIRWMLLVSFLIGVFVALYGLPLYNGFKEQLRNVPGLVKGHIDLEYLR